VEYSGSGFASAAGKTEVTVASFRGAGVITNRGETAARLLTRPACFEQLVKHELGHTLGLIDSPDGGGVMSPSLDCDNAPAGDGSRPMFVPLDPGVSRADRGEAPDMVYDAIACAIGCRITTNATITATNGPTNLTYTLVGSTLTLNWTAPVTNDPVVIDGYNLRAGSAPDLADVASFSTNSTATSFTAAVGGNAVFYIRVRALLRNPGAGTDLSGPSNEIVVVLGDAAVPPGPPTDLTSSVAGTTVTLAWNPPATGPITSYSIQAGSSFGASDLANFNTGSAATFFSASGVDAGTYFVRVRAFSASGTSTASNEEMLTVLAGVCNPPTAPSNLVASVVGSNVTLTWTAGSQAASYQLQVGGGPGLSDLVDRNLLSPATTLFATNVSAGTYFVRLRSINACGLSDPSNELLIIIR
jgi:hypothetical protein